MKQFLPCLFSLLGSLALVSVATSAAEKPSAKAGLGPSFKGPVGLQLYSLRADFARDVPATLEKVRGYGIRNVELAGTYNLAPEKFKELHVVLGTGQMDFPALLKAAKRAGVKWYFIEDESPTAAEQIPQSLRYLEQVRW